jgi:hypothetical protein
MAAEQGIERRRTTLERHAGGVALGQHLEHVFRHDMGRRAAIAEGKRRRLPGVEKCGERARWIGGAHCEALAVDRDERDRPQVRIGIAGILVESLVDRIAVAGEQQRMAVGRRSDDRLCRDVRGGARPVLDDDRIA